MSNFFLGFNDINNNYSNMDNININNYAPINPVSIMDKEQIRLNELQDTQNLLEQAHNYLLGDDDRLFPAEHQPEEREFRLAGAEQVNNLTAENGIASYLQYPIDNTFSLNTDLYGELFSPVTGSAVYPPIPVVSEIPYPLTQQRPVTKAVVHPTMTMVASSDPPPLDPPVINLPVALSLGGSASGFGAEQQHHNFTAAEKRKAIAIDVENNYSEAGGVKKKTCVHSSESSRTAHNLAERRRRGRINDHMKALQECVPNSNKSDKASMLKEATAYLKSLERYKKAYTMNIPMMIPVGTPGQGAYPAQFLNPEHPVFAVYPAKLQNANYQQVLGAHQSQLTLTENEGTDLMTIPKNYW